MSLNVGELVAHLKMDVGSFFKDTERASKSVTQVSKAAEVLASGMDDANKMIALMAQTADNTAAALEKMGGSAKTSESSFGKLVATLGGLVSVAAAYGAVKSAFHMAAESTEADKALKVYDSLGGSIEKLRKATLGMISDSELAKRANLAQTMGISSQDFEGLARVAKAAAAKTGQSVEYMFDSIVTGTARQSRLILDNLGIIVNADAANQKYADALHVSVNALDDFQKKQAFTNEVLEKGNTMLGELAGAGVSFANPYQQMTVAMENLGTEIGRRLQPAFEGMLPAITDIAKTIKEMVGSLSTTDWKDIGSAIGTGLKVSLGIISMMAQGLLGIVFAAKLIKNIAGYDGGKDPRQALADNAELLKMIGTFDKIGEARARMFEAAPVRANASLDEGDVMGGDATITGVHKRTKTKADRIGENKNEKHEEKLLFDDLAAMDERIKKFNKDMEEFHVDVFSGQFLDASQILIRSAIETGEAQYFYAGEMEDAIARMVAAEDERAKKVREASKTVGTEFMHFATGGIAAVDWSQVLTGALSKGGQNMLANGVQALFGKGDAFKNLLGGIKISETVAPAVAGFASTVLTAIQNAVITAVEAWKAVSEATIGRMAGDVLSEGRLRSAMGAGMGAAGALGGALFGIGPTAGAGAPLVAAGGGAAVGAGMAAWDLSTKTQSFQDFQSAMTGAMDEVIQQLEPFWRNMMPLVGLFGEMATVVGDFLAVFLPGPVIVDALFGAMKQLAIGTVNAIIGFDNMHIAMMEIVKKFAELTHNDTLLEQAQTEQNIAYGDRQRAMDTRGRLVDLDIGTAGRRGRSYAERHGEGSGASGGSINVPSGYKVELTRYNSIDPSAAGGSGGGGSSNAPGSRGNPVVTAVETSNEILLRIAAGIERNVQHTEQQARTTPAQRVQAHHGSPHVTNPFGNHP